MNGLVELAGNPVTSPTLTSTIISLLAQLGTLPVYMWQCSILHFKVRVYYWITLYCIFLHGVCTFYSSPCCSDTGFLSGLLARSFTFGNYQQLLCKTYLRFFLLLSVSSMWRCQSGDSSLQLQLHQHPRCCHPAPQHHTRRTLGPTRKLDMFHFCTYWTIFCVPPH